MRKKLIPILTGVILACTLTGTAAWGADDTVSEVTSASPETESSGTETTDTVQSYLTGEQVSADIGRRRPIAVMLGNTTEACPQSGIASAGVIYEVPVEGNITRLMAIIEDYDNLERIGSIRSCRDYYLFYANEFNAIYVHYGQAAFALPYLQQHVIDNLNGITMGSTAFYRTTDRTAPHNAYTTPQLLQNGIESMGYSQEYSEDYDGHFVFADEGTETTLQDITGAISANTVTLGNFTVNKPWFEYDETTKEYKRYQYREAQVDELTGEQLTCDNILLQYSSYTNYDNTSYLNIDAISGGSGKYITRGMAVDIRWEKDAVWGVTHYYVNDTQEVQLNSGVTWVEIIQDDRVDAVTYE